MDDRRDQRLEPGRDRDPDGPGGQAVAATVSMGCIIAMPLRRVILALLIVNGLYAGIWAEFFPRGFYTSFPGFGVHWISMAGSYDEHLIRDIGSFALALTAISVVGIAARSATPGRIAGLGWAVFGVLHFAYHVTHLEGSATGKTVVVLNLVISALLGIVLLFP
ncbi:MAG: hypothetical protein ACRDOI_32440 [Trebonia sp.]